VSDFSFRLLSFSKKESRQTCDSRMKVFSKKDVGYYKEYKTTPYHPSLKRRGDRLSPNLRLRQSYGRTGSPLRKGGEQKITLSDNFLIFNILYPIFFIII